MKKLFFMAVAAIAALSSCTSDNELELNQNTGKEALTFTATMEGIDGGTRATYDSENKCAAWEVGDQILIVSTTVMDQMFTSSFANFSAQTAGTTTTFQPATAGENLPQGILYTSVYPTNLFDKILGNVMPAQINEIWKEGLFNMPMYAKSETTKLNFTNLCGVLAITVKSYQLTSVKSIKVSSSNKGLSGLFNLTHTDDKKPSMNISTDNGSYSVNNAITVTYTDAVITDAMGKVFYIAIPPYTYKNLKIEVSDGTTTMSMTTKNDVDILVERNKIYPITFKDDSAPPAPDGALSGMFSVGDTKPVYFSKGNLYYDGSAFKFEENQYSIATSWNSSHVSNFFWSKTAAAAYAESCSYQTAGAGDVFFTNASETIPNSSFTVNGQTGIWRTLSHAEWNYLFDHYAYKYTSVNGKSGLVIAPAGKTVEDISVYTADAWATAESNGFVFLPNTGYREKDTNIYETDRSCIYWSSTINEENKPYRQFFQWKGSCLDKSFTDANDCWRGIGIRLVTDVR